MATHRKAPYVRYRMAFDAWVEGTPMVGSKQASKAESQFRVYVE